MPVRMCCVVRSTILSHVLVEMDGGVKKYSWKIRDLESVYFSINGSGVFLCKAFAPHLFR